MDLSIIILNHNSGGVLPRCLDSLEAARPELEFEVIVVDNGSTDGSTDRLETEHPGFRFLRAGGNLGFAGGCNYGLARASARHYMLLNPDTEVMPGALPKLVWALDEHPRWGIVGPRMVDGQDQPYTAARRFPRAFDVFCECTRLAYYFPHSRFFAGYFYGDRQLTELDEVDQIEGSALVIRGSLREQVGDLDPQFFLFWEEVDWCRRAKKAGYEIHVVQEAQVRHYRATTMSRYYIMSREHNARSALKYFHKHHGISGLRELRRWMMVGLCLREAGARLLQWFGGGEIAKLRADGARAERAVYRQGMKIIS